MGAAGFEPQRARRTSDLSRVKRVRLVIVDLEPVRLEHFARAAREADPQEGFRA